MDTSIVVRARGGLGFLMIFAALGMAATPARGGMTVLQPQGSFELNVNVAIPADAMGQTIKVPTNGDTNLTSFGFSIAAPSNFPGSAMMAELYAWDGQKPTGPNLFQSSITPIPQNNLGPIVIFNTGGINLQAGQEYVIFLAETPGSAEYFSHLIAGTGPGYTDGSTVFFESIDPSLWTAFAWGVGLPGSDSTDLPQTNFIATFTAPVTAPEPSSLALAAVGSGIGFARMIRARWEPKRRRK
jgi:hypothetical protein